MATSYTNALTGRSINVREGSLTERLVQADDNWTEDKPKPAKKAAQPKGDDGGAGDSGAGGSGPRKATQRKRGSKS